MAKKLSLFEKIMHTMDYLADGIADVVRTGKFSDKLLSFDTEQARNNYNVYKSSWNTQKEEKESKSESKVKAINKVPVKEEGKGIEGFFKKAVYTLFFKAGEEKEKREIRTKIEVLRKMKIINEYKNGTSKENEAVKENEAPQVEAQQNEAAQVEVPQKDMTNEYKFSNRNAELNKIANSLEEISHEEEVTQDVESSIANTEYALLNNVESSIANPEYSLSLNSVESNNAVNPDNKMLNLESSIASPEYALPLNNASNNISIFDGAGTFASDKIASPQYTLPLAKPEPEQTEKAPEKQYTKGELWVMEELKITNPAVIEKWGAKADAMLEGQKKDMENFTRNSSENNKNLSLENNKSNERGAVAQAVEMDM